ncbi:hypothetical protein J8C01_13895 [Chloracidobacterium sp. D]|nr:hypothetical protein J8C01_13895 [Chloracidobacterium sp. D]
MKGASLLTERPSRFQKKVNPMLKTTGKHRCVAGVVALVVVVLMLGVPPGFSTNAQVERRSDRKASGFVHEPQLYRTLFHTIFLLNEQAEEAERAGRTEAAQALRRAFKQEAGLEVEQGVVLDRLAAACEQAVRAVDARARAILAARRANYPDGKLRAGQQPLPPSAELLALQREREAVVLRYRDRLRATFGPRAWEEFEQRVLLPFAAGLSAGGTQRHQPVEDGSGTGNLTTQAGESIVTGSVLISYDPETNLVTGVATTELDYAAQDWYVGQVACSLRDGNGNPLASQSAEDTDGDGTVSVIVQMVGQEGLTTYGARGEYSLRLDIYDPFCGCCGCYLDPWNFQRALLGGWGWGPWYCTVFSGHGPFCTMRSGTLFLGARDVTFQVKPLVAIRRLRFTKNPIKVNIDSTDLDVTVRASRAGLQDRDFAVLEVNLITGPSNPQVSFAYPPGVTDDVELVPGGYTDARFTILSIAPPGNYLLEVRIIDVRRPDGQGGSDSIADRVIIGSPVEITLTVTEP